MSSASMSVNSLIDKFQHPDNKLSQDQESSEKTSPQASHNSEDLEKEQRKDSSIKSEINKQPAAQTAQSQPATVLPSISSKMPRGDVLLLQKLGILSLIGDDLQTFSMSEDSLLEIVRLKVEQERTRQQQIRLELATKNYNILTTALSANIPQHMIPRMCINAYEDNEDETQTQEGNLQPKLLVQMYPQTQPQIQAAIQRAETQTPVHKTRLSQSRTPHSEPGHSRSNSQDYTIPVNFRFGAGSSASTSSTPILGPNIVSGANVPVRRPLSPAKLGAHAVASLNSPSSSYKLPKKPLHLRHLSLPLTTPIKQSVDLSKIDTAQKYPVYLQPPVQFQPQVLPTFQYRLPTNVYPPQGYPYMNPAYNQYYASQRRLPTKSHSRSKSTASISSKSAGTSTMQVKPTPAQPLLKQSKLQNPPSQESMTSFQHVIQFQHWKPELGPSPERQQHKRHKSHADNMSVDLGNLGEREESDEDDVLMG